MKTIVSISISVVVSGCLLSGVPVLHDTAFAISVFMAVLSSVLLPICAFAPVDSFRTGLQGLWLKTPFSALYWFALGYTNHPYLLAASVICYVMYVSLGIAKINADNQRKKVSA